MKKIIILIFFLQLLLQGTCFAIEPKITIIYPLLKQKINASSTFFVGNTNSCEKLKINGKLIPLRKNGSFVEKINLKAGENIFSFEINNKKIIDYTLYSVKNNLALSDKTQKMICLESWAEIIKNDAVIRTAPTMTRLTPLPEGTILKITGKIGNDYRFNYGRRFAFIEEKDVKILAADYTLITNQLASLTIEENNCSTFIKIPLKNKVPVEIVENYDNSLDLSFYNTDLNLDTYKVADNTSIIENMAITQPYENTVKLKIKTKKQNGYSYGYEGNCFVLRLKKINALQENPLQNRVITIDAGHGGAEFGAIGPTGIAEKTVNLKISQYLKILLEQQGAKVIMTREEDKEADLYKRVEIAKQNNSDILLSIHNNALPDGADPSEIHGSEVYFYHPHSFPLANAIQFELLKEIGFKDNGIANKSLALTRPSDFPSVLIESGFMIYPDEYEFLITDAGQKAVAKAIAEGVKKYFKEL